MNKLKYLLLIILLNLFVFGMNAKVVEEIYAIVNSEPITKSDFQNMVNLKLLELNKNSTTRVFTLTKKQKEEALNILIDSKLLLSKAKLKNYDIKNDLKVWVTQIKKENNFKSDAEFEAALKAQGINMTLKEFLESRKSQLLQQKLVQEEVSRNISIDNAEIMAYFRNNKKKYMTPTTLELNCILLKKDKNNIEILKEKMKKISNELKTGDFIEIAKKYSELTGDPKTNYYLGKFKKTELNKKIADASMKLKEKEYSKWLETENAWYIVQLKKLNKSKFVEYKSVRNNIQNEIFIKKREIELKKYIKDLRKKSYIEIFVKF